MTEQENEENFEEIDEIRSDPWTLSSAVDNILKEKKKISNSDPSNEKLIQIKRKLF